MPERSAIEFDGYVIDVVQNRKEGWNPDAYPFNLPAVKSWETLQLHDRVTFLVGENGSGKSTLIEAIAIAASFNAEGGFLRAESYFNVATNIDELDQEPMGGARIIEAYGGVSLHEQSHGESFMSLVAERFRGKGLYILDEPEAALSPQRQLTFLTHLHDLVEQDSQFIIATHSPIILAYPNAWIYQMTDTGPERLPWDALEHVDITRQFLNNSDVFLDTLLEREDDED